MRLRKKSLTLLMSLVLALSLLFGTAAFAADDASSEEVTYVCRIDNTYYTSLEEAIEAAADTAKIRLTADIEVDSTISISGKSIYLYLMGYTISASDDFGSDSLISLNNASVNIQGGTIRGSCTNLIYVWNSSLILGGVTLDGNSDAEKGICLYGSGACATQISDCTIQNVKYGIYAYKCNPSGDSTSGIVNIGTSTIDASYVGIWLYMSTCQGIYGSTITGGTHGIVVNSNCGDGGYSTELTAYGSAITGTGSYAIYMADSNWGGSGTLKLSLTGCTLSGADNIGIYAHSYMAAPLEENYSVSYAYTNITCYKDLGNWTAYYTAHSYESVATDPTCTDEGYTTYICSICGDSYVDDYTDATGHDYDGGVWTWTQTDEGYSVSAVWTCRNDENHVYEAEAEVTSETTAATCTGDGSIVYTAAAIGPDGEVYTDTLTVSISATGHSYGEPSWTWTETDDGYTVTATFVCVNDSTHIYTETAAVASAADDDGNTVYTATVAGPDGAEYTASLTVEASAAASVQTGDPGILMWALVLAAAMAGLLVCRKRIAG